jgi:hypothetical protein
VGEIMGKNYSMNSKADARDKRDLYSTPTCLTETFLDAYIFGNPLEDTIWECACGNHAISNVLVERGYKVVSSDKYNAVPIDFLTTFTQVPYIVTNPPYRYAMEFILQAKKLAMKGFAFLLPLSYLHGKARYDKIWMDKDYPLESIYVYNRYPMLGKELREDGLIETGMQVYAWFIWNKKCKHSPEIHWLDIDKYIVRKEKR